MGHETCCVVNCKNTGRNSDSKFYIFPTSSWKQDQKMKWIAAVRRINTDGSSWTPRARDTICSAHFVGGKKSDETASPSYIPQIFPAVYGSKKIINETAMLKKHERFKARLNRNMKDDLLNSNSHAQDNFSNKSFENSQPKEMLIAFEENVAHQSKVDQGCQIDMFSEYENKEMTFTCNRYIYSEFCHAEIQTEIPRHSRVVATSIYKTKDKGCGTNHKTYKDQSTTAKHNDFVGISSIQSDEQLTDLAGITFGNFECLLKKMSEEQKCCDVKKRNKLLIFLMKIKTGMTFSALSVLFGVHRTTISRIFYTTLKDLAAATANFVFWPSKDVVQATMPECFRPDYADTRVIIDCTEFRISVPAAVDNRVLCYSHYKKGFTAKVLIGITPGGFISFKSSVAGGRKSDSQITVESGIIDCLEPGDVVLADKGFPQIKKIIDDSGIEVNVVMPPFLQSSTEFSKQETEATYNIARVRIHVERIMQRLRLYQILQKIPTELLHCIDDIVHMCCVLVNLQASIFSKGCK